MKKAVNILDKTVKSRRGVMPANAGIQNLLKILDPGVRRDDGKREIQTFYQTVILNQAKELIVGNLE